MKAVVLLAAAAMLATLAAAPLAHAADPLPTCIQGPCLPVECIQARPYSDLCQGDVVGAVCYVADCSIVAP